MTWALCFRCGATKFGAICPCPECSVATTGDMNLDIAFSDHNMSKKSLEQFGDVVRSIHCVCEDDELCFWTFIHFVSTRHSNILSVEMPPDRRARCASILDKANPPAVVVEDSEWGRIKRKKPWWRFW